MTEPWSLLADAFAYAFRIHAGQLRKGTTIPYISHLMGVSSLVLEHGGDENLAIAGMLHDAIENVGAAKEAVILDRFEPRGADVVCACTDADVLPEPPWQARKDAYLVHLETADPDVLLVSCAARLHNAGAILWDLRAVGIEIFSKFTAGRADTL